MVLKQCQVKDNVLFLVYFIYLKKFLAQFIGFNAGGGGVVVPPPCPFCPTPGQSLLLGDIFWLLGLGVRTGVWREEARNAVELAAMLRADSPNKELSGHSTNRAKTEKAWPNPT